MWQEALMGGGDDWYNVILITAPAGASIDVDDGDEQITAVGTGSQQAIAIHNENSTYAITVVASGFTKTDSVTTGTTSGVVVSKSFNYGLIELTFDNDFRSQSFSITDGTSTATGTFPASGNTIDIDVPNIGSWTISSTVSGDTFESVISVTDLDVPVSGEIHVRPDGKTVTPTDDIQTWLECAGVKNKPYTTLEEVLGDKETLQILISDQNAVDYMVRSKTWIRQVTNPVMTSNTAPYGVASASSVHNDTSLGCQAWNAFDDNPNKIWHCNNAYVSNQWLQYEFPEPVRIVRAVVTPTYYAGNSRVKTYKYQASNDGTTFDDLTEVLTADNESSGVQISGNLYVGTPNEVVFTKNIGTYKYYRIYVIDEWSGIYSPSIDELKFYSLVADHGITEDPTAMRYIGKRNYAADTLLADVNPGLVPLMTSATTPSGEVISSSTYSATVYPDWKAFDGISNEGWTPAGSDTVNNAYVGYKFTAPKIVRHMSILTNSNATYTYLKTARLEGSNDDFATFDVVKNNIDLGGADHFEVSFENDTAYESYRLVITELGSGAVMENIIVYEIQFYAKPVDEPQWSDGICESEYMESVLNVSVPTMTSDNTPTGVGEVISENMDSSAPAWRGFDGDLSTYFGAHPSTTTASIGFKFPSPQKISCFEIIKPNYSSGIYPNCKIQAKNDADAGWTDIATFDVEAGTSKSYGFPTMSTAYNSWGIQLNRGSVASISAYEVQFYGREDVDESYIDIYSAASDNDIHYMSGSTPVTVAGTDSNGKGSVSRSFLPNGDYDLYSSVAMDPNGDLSTEYYHKKVTVTNSTIEIMLMPDDTIYWYGNKYFCDQLSAANGWNLNYSGWSSTDGGVTFNTYDVTLHGYANSICAGIGSKNKIKASIMKMLSYSGANHDHSYMVANVVKETAKNTNYANIPRDSTYKWTTKHMDTDNYYIAAFNCYNTDDFLKALYAVGPNPLANFFGAANDTVYYMSGGVQVVFAETNELGEAVVDYSKLTPGSYTLISSVAKDPDNLSNPYSKMVTVDGNPIYFMPDGVVLYWYGWKSDRIEEASPANGWSGAFSNFVSPVYNTDNVYLKASDNSNYSEIGTKDMITGCTSAHLICNLTNPNSSSFDSTICGGVANTKTYQPVGANRWDGGSYWYSAFATKLTTISIAADGYIMVGIYRGSAGSNVYALWAD